MTIDRFLIDYPVRFTVPPARGVPEGSPGDPGALEDTKPTPRRPRAAETTGDATMMAPRARATAAISELVLAFNPRQRRDRQGRWADEPGDGPGDGPSADLTRSNVDMTTNERQFLSDYVEDGRSYREINDALRGQREMTPEMADKVARLDGLAGRARLDGDATLYRAMSVKVRDPIMGQLIEGEGTIADPGYGSASGDRGAVEDFKGTTDNTVVFEIQARKGQPVLVLGDDLSETAMMQTAQEVLLPRGYRLRIDSVSNRRRSGQTVWTVKATYEGADSPAITAAFNPHQLRGPDGKWIKMPTHLRKERRRERDRARREAKKAAERDADAPSGERASDRDTDNTYRRQRDQFNRQVLDEAINAQNDNAFENDPDPELDDRLDQLQRAFAGGRPQDADEHADALHTRLAERYPGAAQLDRPRRREPEPPPDQLDQVEVQRKLRDALDDYNAEVFALAREWVDTLGDDDSPEATELRQQFDALRRAFIQNDPDQADRVVPGLLDALVEMGQQRYELPVKPTESDVATQIVNLRLAGPRRKSNPLLASNAPAADRRAALAQAAAQGEAGDEFIGQGAMGETKRVMFNDGTQAIYKKAKADWGMSADITWTPKQQTDAEELASLVGGALGLRAPAVQRISDDELYMELVEDAAPATSRFFSRDAPDHTLVPGEILGSDDGFRMGLLDVLVGNPDRHGFNWMVDDQDRLYPIDHGLAFVNLKGTNFSDAGRSPFAREHFIHPDGRFKENILSRRDVRWLRQQVEALAPEFLRVGQPALYTQVQNRLRQLEIRARGGSQHQLPAPREENEQ